MLALPASIKHLIVVSGVPFIFPEVSSVIPAVSCVDKAARDCLGCVQTMKGFDLDPGVFK